MAVQSADSNMIWFDFLFYYSEFLSNNVCRIFTVASFNSRESY